MKLINSKFALLIFLMVPCCIFSQGTMQDKVYEMIDDDLGLTSKQIQERYNYIPKGDWSGATDGTFGFKTTSNGETYYCTFIMGKSGKCVEKIDGYTWDNWSLQNDYIKNGWETIGKNFYRRGTVYMKWEASSIKEYFNIRIWQE